MKLAKIVKHCRIDKPSKFQLADFDPAESFGLSTDIEEVRMVLGEGVARLEDCQPHILFPQMALRAAFDACAITPQP